MHPGWCHQFYLSKNALALFHPPQVSYPPHVRHFQNQSDHNLRLIALPFVIGCSELIQHLFSFLEHLPPLYAYIALGSVILLESTGIPLPAESLLIFASLYASHTHHLTPESLILSAVIGAIMGDNIGYLIGHQLGYKLLQKYGNKIGLHEDRLTLGRYLFRHVGGIGVLLGRFAAFLRILIALLAGASRMPWHIFLIFNALGGVIWGGGYVLVAYALGSRIDNFTGPLGLTIGGIMLAFLVGSFFFLRHHEHSLTEKAIAEEKRLHSSKKSFRNAK